MSGERFFWLPVMTMTSPCSRGDEQRILIRLWGKEQLLLALDPVQSGSEEAEKAATQKQFQLGNKKTTRGPIRVWFWFRQKYE